MNETTKEPIISVNMDNTEATFDNLTILKEFSNIVNLVRNEDFLEVVPKTKLHRIKWVPIFNCLKRDMFDEMVQEMNSMWEYEHMPQKLEVLEKQKMKFEDIAPKSISWRPQLADVKAQLKTHDGMNLLKQKKLLEALAKEYEARVDRLKKTVSAKRGYIKAIQMDIQKYQKKNEDFISRISDVLENHHICPDTIISKIDIDCLDWSKQLLEYDKENA